MARLLQHRCRRRLFERNVMKRINKVQVGKRFRAIGVTGKPTYAYEVEAMFRSNIDEHDYARLVEIVDRTRTNTIAVATLMDPPRYGPPPLDGAAQGPPPTALGQGQVGRGLPNT